MRPESSKCFVGSFHVSRPIALRFAEPHVPSRMIMR
jgi:hypothetical protein